MDFILESLVMVDAGSQFLLSIISSLIWGGGCVSDSLTPSALGRGSGSFPYSSSSRRSSAGARGSLQSFSPFPSHRPGCILFLVVFILLLLTSFRVSESCPLPPQVGDCLSLLVLLMEQGCSSLSSGTVVGSFLFPILSQDPIPFG